MVKQRRTVYNTRSRRMVFERRWSKRSTKGLVKFTSKAFKLSPNSKNRLFTPPVPKKSFISVKPRPLPPSSTTCPEPTRSFIRYYSETMDIPDMPITSTSSNIYHPTSMLNTSPFEYPFSILCMTPKASSATTSANTMLTSMKETFSLKKDIVNIKHALDRMKL